jgi:hypothetical protein
MNNARPVTWAYPAELLDALAGLGLAPRPDSPPVLVREALNEMYRYELRRLRDRYLAKELDKPSLHERVIALRKKYWPLTLQRGAWEQICRNSTS